MQGEPERCRRGCRQAVEAGRLLLCFESKVATCRLRAMRWGKRDRFKVGHAGALLIRDAEWKWEMGKLEGVGRLSFCGDGSWRKRVEGRPLELTTETGQ